jgi:hypothetical protein
LDGPKVGHRDRLYKPGLKRIETTRLKEQHKSRGYMEMNDDNKNVWPKELELNNGDNP